MSDRTTQSNRSFAWTRNRSRCTPMYVPSLRPFQGEKPDEITNTNAVERPTCSAQVEPKAGRHFTFPTPDRSAFEFAKVIFELALHYPHAETIHLVLDNLNIHRRKSLTNLLGAKVGGEIWDRFTVHYTPTHGSWLHQAEIEIGIFSRQCLGHRRLPDLQTLRRESQAWNRRMNRHHTKINWRFDRKAARRKFGYKQKAFKRSAT
jgi:hypothetical protein